MTRVHDMGGRFGDGPVVSGGENEPVFVQEWHARACAMTIAAGMLGHWNIDSSRHARECLTPKDYSRFSYYEKWLAALADLLVEKNLLTLDELRSGEPDAQTPVDRKAVNADVVASVLERGAPVDRPSNIAQQFHPGDLVKTLRPGANRLVDGGHTRLPAYAAGAQGRIVRCHGTHVFPDSNAHGLGEAPEPLYAVAFAAGELWAAPENPRDEVVLDLWQSYLVPA